MFDERQNVAMTINDVAFTAPPIRSVRSGYDHDFSRGDSLRSSQRLVQAEHDARAKVGEMNETPHRVNCLELLLKVGPLFIEGLIWVEWMYLTLATQRARLQ